MRRPAASLRDRAPLMSLARRDTGSRIVCSAALHAPSPLLRPVCPSPSHYLLLDACIHEDLAVDIDEVIYDVITGMLLLPSFLPPAGTCTWMHACTRT